MLELSAPFDTIDHVRELVMIVLVKLILQFSCKVLKSKILFIFGNISEYIEINYFCSHELPL